MSRNDPDAADNGADAPPTSVRAHYVSDRFIETLRIPLQMGTGLSGKDHTPSVVISYRLWQDRFGGRPDVLGQPLVVSGKNLVVVGVLSREFTGLPPSKIDVFVSNAGICPFHAFLDMPRETFERTMTVNLHGAYYMIQAAANRVRMAFPAMS